MYVIDKLKDPEQIKELHEFDSTAKIKFYIRSDPPFGLSTINYYIVERNQVTGLYNRYGEFLYDVGSLDPCQVLKRIEERSFFNWRTHGKPRSTFNNKTYVKGEDWGAECIRKFGGSIVHYLRHHPNRNYEDFVSMITNEGYRINGGFVEK